MRREAAEIDLVEQQAGVAAAKNPCMTSIWLHASCVELNGTGVVLLGPSGSGKSDLALRLIDTGARLVADDQLGVARDGACLFGHPAERLAGLLEVRGFGIVKLPWCAVSRLGLAVELAPQAALPRLPEPGSYDLLGVSLPYLRLDPRAPSACAKVRLALAAERIA